MEFKRGKLLDYMARIPLLYHEILVHFQDFRVGQITLQAKKSPILTSVLKFA
ncbi:MAG: hypothetical protein NT166_31385 [Candidatus Aminicenantes bacterium]|nr:hypothetical protein [Candidatus Aminicenantes bacterium]